MIRLTFIIFFQIALILITILIMHLGYRQGDMELLLLVLGIPLYIYMIFFYLKLINRIKVEKEFVTIKNLVFGKVEIPFKDIQHWEEIYTIHLFARNLLLRTDRRKIIISNLIDKKNYKILHDKLNEVLAMGKTKT